MYDKIIQLLNCRGLKINLIDISLNIKPNCPLSPRNSPENV